MEWITLKHRLGSWDGHIKPFYDSGKFKPIFEELKKISSGSKVCPASINLFRCFSEVDYNELKCVIVGENPYNKVVKGEPVAIGMLFGSNNLQENLKEFYKGIENELYSGGIDYTYTNDISYLSKQGILMLNSSFTIEQNAEKGHSKIWKPFMEFLLKEVISVTGVPILFLGRSNQYLPLVEKTNYCFQLPLPQDNIPWNTGNVFSEINTHEWETNKDVINWLPDEDLPF